MINYVTGFMFSKNGKHVALIEKLNPAWQRGQLNGVGGKIEFNETPQEAMAREFKEETGVSTSKTAWKLYCVVSRPEKYNVNFLCCDDNKVYDVRSIEDEKVMIYDVADLPDNIIDNLKWLIPMAQDRNIVFSKPVCIEEERVTE